MDFTSNRASWIWSVNNGSPLKSDSQSANLNTHSDKDEFTFDLTQARGGSSLNPFTEAAVSASSTSSASTSTAGSNAYPNAASTASSSTSDGDNSGSNADDETSLRATIAHGTIMGFTFIIVFPLGALLIRLCSFKALVWVHAGVQIFGYILALTGLSLGIFIGMVPTFKVSTRAFSELSDEKC